MIEWRKKPITLHVNILLSNVLKVYLFKVIYYYIFLVKQFLYFYKKFK